MATPSSPAASSPTSACGASAAASGAARTAGTEAIGPPGPRFPVMGRDCEEFGAKRGNHVAPRSAPPHIAGAAHRPLEPVMHRRRFLTTAAATVGALATLTLPSVL